MHDRFALLHVDDDPAFAALAGEFLRREDPRFEITHVPTTAAGLAHLESAAVDCVVSDFDMPERTGVEFLERIRSAHPDLPFVLFTGKGSEEVASEAISAGVSDYVQKQGGTDQYAVLANRITNAVEAAAAKRERRQWKQAVETATEGIAILDNAGRFVQMNAVFAEAHGHDPDELVGRPHRAVYPDAVADRFERAVWPRVRSMGAWSGRAVGERADGSRFELDLSLAALDDGGHVCVMKDVDDRVPRERVLLRYETVVEALGDPVFAMDRAGRYTYVNDAFVDETGYSRDEILGDEAASVVSQADLERTREVIRDLLADDEKRSARLTVERIDADGNRRPYESRLALIRSPDGDFRGVAGTTREVSEWVDTVERLESHRSRIESVARLVAEDFREPLEHAVDEVDRIRSRSEEPGLDDVARVLDRLRKVVDDGVLADLQVPEENPPLPPRFEATLN